MKECILGQTATALAREVTHYTLFAILSLPIEERGMALPYRFIHIDVITILLHLIPGGHFTKLFAFQLILHYFQIYNYTFRKS